MLTGRIELQKELSQDTGYRYMLFPKGYGMLLFPEGATQLLVQKWMNEWMLVKKTLPGVSGEVGNEDWKEM